MAETRAAHEELEHQLRAELDRWNERPAHPLTAPLVYVGPHDFVLQHGERHEPEMFGMCGAEGACYGNAIILAVALDLRYVEGFALPCPEESLAGATTHPMQYAAVQHAWVRDPVSGTSFEVTWPRLGVAYSGVEFSAGRADDATWEGDASVLDDFRRGWPLLREQWRGEDFKRRWPPSPPMRLLTSGIDPVGNLAYAREWLRLHREVSSAA